MVKYDENEEAKSIQKYLSSLKYNSKKHLNSFKYTLRNKYVSRLMPMKPPNKYCEIIYFYNGMVIHDSKLNKSFSWIMKWIINFKFLCNKELLPFFHVVK